MKPFILCMLSFAVVMMFPFSANAKLYKWVDKKGVIHFSNSAPPVSTGQNVETEKEIEGSASQGVGSQNIDSLLDSYKRDAQDQQAKDLEEHLHHRSRRSRKSGRMAEYYEQRIKEKKAELEDRRADLEDVKRQSYSDTRRHNERVRRYKRRVNDTKMEIERLQEKYRKAEGR